MAHSRNSPASLYARSGDSDGESDQGSFRWHGVAGPGFPAPAPNTDPTCPPARPPRSPGFGGSASFRLRYWHQYLLRYRADVPSRRQIRAAARDLLCEGALPFHLITRGMGVPLSRFSTNAARRANPQSHLAPLHTARFRDGGRCAP